VANEEFYSFEEALSELRLKEEELKRLVSEGEIRAFREGDTMRLRRGDVEALRDELAGGGEVVDLGVGDELVFEDDADLVDETGMATEEISDVDTIIEDDVEDIGEFEMEEEPAVAVAAPVRRTSARAALQEEAETEGMGIRAALLLSSLVMICALPVIYAVSTGKVSALAEPFLNMAKGGD
jgi:excisionase family DNA binding protein